MKPAKLFLFAVFAVIAAAFTALALGSIAEFMGYSGKFAAVVGGAASLGFSAMRLAAPGLNVAFVGMPAAGIFGADAVSQDRALLDAITKHNLKLGFEDIVPLPGYLRSENVLSVQTTIPFEIKDNALLPGQAIGPSEHRLKQNDAFYVTHYSVMFYSFPTAGGAAARARARLHSFPNDAVFGLNAPSLAGSYNGYLQLRINETVFFDALDMNRFLFAEQAQQGLAVSTAGANNAYFNDAARQSESFANLTAPLVRLNGQFNNQFQVQLPDNISFQLVAADTVVAVLYLRGWSMQNGGGTRSPR